MPMPRPFLMRRTNSGGSNAVSEGHRALVTPVLLSYGGIELGIKKRLEGLRYTIAAQGLLPDTRLAHWVLASVRAVSH